MSAATPAGPGHTIVRLLSLMRDGKEIRQYLQRFAAGEEPRFTVAKIGGAVLRDAKPALADALAFLQTVGLAPVVVHGAGPQLDKALSDRGIAIERHDGLRVTRPEALAVVRDVMLAANLEIVEALRAAGARAEPVPFGVIEADLIDEKRLGLVGEPRAAKLERVHAAVQAGAIPVIASLGGDAEGRLLNVNADAAVRALVNALNPAKIVFLTETGGVLDQHGARVSSINLATDYKALMEADWLTGGMRLKVGEIKRLLEALPLTASVSITRPDELAQELFTHGGSGTLVRLGERLIVTGEKGDLDAARAAALVADAFGRPPAPGWWEGLALERAYVTERYRAGAFVTRLGEAAYLDKFAVLEEARGEGLGQTVWRRLIEDWPSLIWRAHPDNPISDFYFRNCDGAVRRDGWIVFWRGMGDLRSMAELVDAACARPATLAESAA